MGKKEKKKEEKKRHFRADKSYWAAIASYKKRKQGDCSLRNQNGEVNASPEIMLPLKRAKKYLALLRQYILWRPMKVGKLKPNVYTSSVPHAHHKKEIASQCLGDMTETI